LYAACCKLIEMKRRRKAAATAEPGGKSEENGTARSTKHNQHQLLALPFRSGSRNSQDELPNTPFSSHKTPSAWCSHQNVLLKVMLEG
jgi:hypothetical protein